MPDTTLSGSSTPKTKIPEKFTLMVLSSGAVLLPLFFMPLTPQDPFLIPKGVLLSVLGCFALVSLPWLSGGASGRPGRYVITASILFLAAVAFSVPGSTNLHEGLSELRRLGYLLIVFLAAALTSWTAERVRRLMWAASLAGAVVSAAIIVEYFGIMPFYRYPLSETRLYSFFGYQNIAAQYLVFVLLWSAGLWASAGSSGGPISGGSGGPISGGSYGPISGGSGGPDTGSGMMPRALALALVVLTGTALLLTFSRGAVLAAALGFALFIFLASRDGRQRGSVIPVAAAKITAALAAALAIVIVAGIVIGKDEKTARLAANLFVKGDSLRLTLWGDTAEMFLDNPLRGVGAGNYRVVYPRYKSGDWQWLTVYAHNEYLHIAAESGVVGLVAFGAFLYAVYRRGRRALESVSTLKERLLYFSLISASVATLVHGAVSYNLHSPASSYLFFLSLGLLCSGGGGGSPKPAHRLKKFSFSIKLLAVLLALLGISFEYRVIMGHYYHGRALNSSRLKMTDDAVSYSIKALLHQPHSPEYHYFIASKYRLKGDAVRARMHDEKFRRLSPYLMKRGPRK